jgi:hypothetical protein
MQTDLPSWAQMTTAKAGKIRRQGETPRLPSAKPPISRRPLEALTSQAADAASNQASAVRKAAATASHNTFRPEIFRVTEGYLN